MRGEVAVKEAKNKDLVLRVSTLEKQCLVAQ